MSMRNLLVSFLFVVSTSGCAVFQSTKGETVSIDKLTRFIRTQLHEADEIMKKEMGGDNPLPLKKITLKLTTVATEKDDGKVGFSLVQAPLGGFVSASLENTLTQVVTVELLPGKDQIEFQALRGIKDFKLARLIVSLQKQIFGGIGPMRDAIDLARNSLKIEIAFGVKTTVGGGIKLTLLVFEIDGNISSTDNLTQKLTLEYARPGKKG